MQICFKILHVQDFNMGKSTWPLVFSYMLCLIAVEMQKNTKRPVIRANTMPIVYLTDHRADTNDCHNDHNTVFISYNI